jgi:hypothetical protein
MADVDFREIMKSEGLPTTEQELQAQWQTELASQGNPITNDSSFSPFRRLIDAMMVQPAKQILDVIADVALPSQFVATASGTPLILKGAAVQLTPLNKSKAEGLISITRTTTDQALTISAGFVVQSPLIKGINYSVITTEAVTLPIGEANALVAVIATAEGSAYNLPANYYNVQAEPIENVAVTNSSDWLTLPGRDDETEEDFRLRIRNQFNLVGEYHTDAVYKGMLTEQFGIRQADIFIQHNAPRGPGTANCYVLLPVGNPSAQFIAEINSYITDDGNHGHGDDLQVFAIPETLHAITLDIWPVVGVTTAQLSQLAIGVENFIRAAFRENTAYVATTTIPGKVFSFSRLSQELHRQFPRLERLVFDNSDIQSGVSIPRINTLVVNANG